MELLGTFGEYAEPITRGLGVLNAVVLYWITNGIKRRWPQFTRDGSKWQSFGLWAVMFGLALAAAIGTHAASGLPWRSEAFADAVVAALAVVLMAGGVHGVQKTRTERRTARARGWVDLGGQR